MFDTKNLGIFVCALLWTTSILAQCPFGGNNTSGTAVTPTTTAQFTPNITAGDWFWAYLTAGVTYTFDTCGLAAWDTELTLYNASAAPLTYDNNGCGFSITSSLTYTPTVTDWYIVRLTQLSCSASFNTSSVRYQSAAPAVPALEINDVTVDEGAGTATFTVTHTGANTSGLFTANYQTFNGSALSGSDYTFSSGTVILSGAAGYTTQFTVPIIDDLISEATENFVVFFTGVSDPSVSITDTGTGFITDNDLASALSINDITVNENAGSATFTVTHTGANTAGPFSVNYQTINSSALAGSDYTFTSGTLFFTGIAGDTEFVTVPIIDDFIAESSELYGVQFTSISDPAVTITDVGLGTILDNDSAAPAVVVDDVSIAESGSFAILTVTHTGSNTSGSFSVNYQTVNGSALAPADYTATSGVLLFNGTTGDTEQIYVPIVNDALVETSETLSIQFTATSDPSVNILDTAVVTILDDDASGTTPLTLFEEFHGYVDYTSTGGTLLTANSGCTVFSSSSNTLTSAIPAGSQIQKAYLYWAHSGAVPDTQVTFEGNTVNADGTYTAVSNISGVLTFQGSVSDVTSIVQGISNPSAHVFNFSGLSVDTSSTYCSTSVVIGGWSLFVFYENTSLPASSINLYQGFNISQNSTYSFTLDGFFAIGGTGSKTTALSWEGDNGLANNEVLNFTTGLGTFKLVGDGDNNGVTINNPFNSTIYDNTATPIVNNASAWALDLDTYDVSSYITTGETSATTTVQVGQDLVILNAVVLKVPSNLIAGTVFEDVNYGGGAGRDYVSASGVPLSGASVELYNSGGTLIQTETTDLDGTYAFAGMANGTYSVRVVNNTVKSSRPGGDSCLGCMPIQTFRTDYSSSTLSPVTTDVGGANPSAVDASSGSLVGAQSVASVSINSEGAAGVDFGFNFNTIVNTNSNGQGSLAQFITNSNGLGNIGLDIESNSIFDPAAGEDTSIFMIPPTSDSLGRTADTNFSGSYFSITQIAAMPAITDADTHIDGRSQTAYSGDTNTGTVGSGGINVGVTGNALPNYTRPEIEVVGFSPETFAVEANGVVLRNLAINGDGIVGVRNTGGTSGNPVVLTENLIGVDATGTLGNRLQRGVQNTGSGALEISNNYIAQSDINGIHVFGGSSTDIQYNHMDTNGTGACSDAIALEGSSPNVQIEYNLIENSAALGIEGFGFTGGAVIQENTIRFSGQNGGDCSPGVKENSGIRLEGNNSLITENRIYDNGGAGIVIANGGTGNLISQNAIYNNGTTTPALGIDLDLSGAANSMGDGITVNDMGDVDTGANHALNFPIISAAYLSRSNLIVRGWARPGATVEVFLTDITEGTAVQGDNQLGLSFDYGEGQTFLGSGVEGSASDLDSSTSSYSIADGNTDATHRFELRIAVPPNTEVGNFITATATLGNSTSEFSPGLPIRIRSVITNRRITYRVKPN